MVVVVLAPLTRSLASTIRTARAPDRRSAMVVPVLAVAASSWGVLMGVAPVLQIRRMLREHSSRDVSLGYFLILLAGFVLWISYGIAAGNMALVIPNAVALFVGIALVTVAVRLRHDRAGKARLRAHRHGLLILSTLVQGHGHQRAGNAALPGDPRRGMSGSTRPSGALTRPSRPTPVRQRLGGAGDLLKHSVLIAS
jgi:MtN3 and saliva related transmembrane protein